jgi:hypothetical protein
MINSFCRIDSQVVKEDTIFVNFFRSIRPAG